MAPLTVPCPVCTSRTQIISVIWDSYYKSVRRWRCCQKCDYRWATIEIDHDQATLLTRGPRKPQEDSGPERDPRDP
jgi:transcriptional regulator NrdR family protein